MTIDKTAAALIESWLRDRRAAAYQDAIAHPEGHGNRAFYNGQAIAYENALSLVQSHLSKKREGGR